jgi:hypothetical protein
LREKQRRLADLISLGVVMKKSLEIGFWTVNRSSTIIKDNWIDLRAADCTTPAGVNISRFADPAARSGECRASPTCG